MVNFHSRRNRRASSPPLVKCPNNARGTCNNQVRPYLCKIQIRLRASHWLSGKTRAGLAASSPINPPAPPTYSRIRGSQIVKLPHMHQRQGMAIESSLRTQCRGSRLAW